MTEFATIEGPSLSQEMAAAFSGWAIEDLTSKAREVAVMDLIDMAGLCLAARREPYIRQIAAGWDSEGKCTAIGQAQPLMRQGLLS